MNWRHILDEQPKNGDMIVQINPDPQGYHLISLREYVQHETWESFLDFCKEFDCPLPNFWWMPASEFPFPKQKNENVF